MDRDWLEPDDFSTLKGSTAMLQFRLPPNGVVLEDVERQLLVQALERGRKPDAGRPSARHQSRPGSLPD